MCVGSVVCGEMCMLLVLLIKCNNCQHNSQQQGGQCLEEQLCGYRKQSIQGPQI